MEALLGPIVELAALLSPNKIEAIANRLQKGPVTDAEVPSLVATAPARRALWRLISAMDRTSSSDLVRGMLLGAARANAAARDATSIELVWTGPTTSAVPTRRTEQVLLDVIGSAKEELFLVSFVAYKVASVVDALNAAVRRGAAVQILIEASVGKGGSLDQDMIAAMRASVPGATLLSWVNRPEPFSEGRVHAKLALADDEAAFVTSANITGYALEKNIEAGLLVRGTDVPKTLRAHLHGLVATKVLSVVA
ncbi:DISARM system phospholipase D-like protein DrmC [Phenylobacterium sp. 58.2.17]|uniref:DISARM system phospholipase D-like protein DrmC n=1 Tax=Phenylobacterium sp. 58.2.17 TaxID=2969306 RepID=UPI002264B208|nr:DISARM system phospholipase D-like protein DrmC [Phenylobacterium sp. 58.2.17]MCX7584906.1 DISARM system phospholipase D-like protein DrmC [Phenylobacterium sp. 58.2.17]